MNDCHLQSRSRGTRFQITLDPADAGQLTIFRATNKNKPLWLHSVIYTKMQEKVLFQLFVPLFAH